MKMIVGFSLWTFTKLLAKFGVGASNTFRGRAIGVQFTYVEYFVVDVELHALKAKCLISVWF